MIDPTGKHGRRKVVLAFTALGFLVAVFIWAYCELTAQTLAPINMRLWTVLIALCPPSLLTVPLFDVDPGTLDFALLWLVIALVNCALYGAIGWVAAMWYGYIRSARK